jgi:dihydrofolate reductase
MRKIHVLTFVTLDGVMQAPGGPEEDESGGFRYGGWLAAYLDDAFGQEMGKQMGHDFDLLLGRHTYDIFAGYWPKQTGAYGDPLNKAKKYVATHRPLDNDWNRTAIRLEGDVAQAIRELKRSAGPELQVHGSRVLIQTLLENDLVDELWLKIFPVTLGSGVKLFEGGTRPAAFDVVETRTTSTGVIFAKYRRAGEVKLGRVPEPE